MRARGEEVRIDDTPEVLSKRLASYRTLTEPLIHYYSERRKLLTVDGMMTIEHVTREINRILSAIGRWNPGRQGRPPRRPRPPRRAEGQPKSAKKAAKAARKAAKPASKGGQKGRRRSRAKGRTEGQEDGKKGRRKAAKKVTKKRAKR